MKFWKFLIAPVIAAALVVSGGVVYQGGIDVVSAIIENSSETVPYHRSHPAPIQQKSSHMMSMQKDHRTDGVCTATAIGPHVLLTAEHCDENEKYKSIKLDLSPTVYNIIATKSDGHEHLLLGVDGPEFHDIAEYKVREAVPGEPAFIYGYGGEEYPAIRKDGNVVDEFDPSEIDKAAGLHYYDIQWIPGDSGSAIYGMDGSIIGIVTFHRSHYGSFREGGGYTVSFPANFVEAVKEIGKGVDIPSLVEPDDPKDDPDSKHKE